MVFPRRPIPKIVINTPQQLRDQATPKWRKIVREARRPRYFGLYAAGLYLYDHEFQDDAYQRTIRTLWTGLVVTIDFKWNFSPGKTELINDLHQRTADRVANLIRSNGGLYIKLGQQIGTQAAVLPVPYRNAFTSFTDSAPHVPYSQILPVFQAEFDGKSPHELFAEFDETAFAAASIAQVHRARMFDGREVAVKVQKPSIRRQIEWDLWSYRTMMYMMEKVFDVPTVFVAQYVSEQMRKETSFIIEGQNAQRTIDHLEKTPSLKGKVYIPKVFHELSTDRVLTMEYVNGVRIDEKAKILKWGFSLKEVMDVTLNLFAAQIFEWGWVHCDPHPGNILVRPNPVNLKKPQVVLVDHGLYVPLSDKFRKEYSALWRSLFVLDLETIQATAKAWGVTFDTDMFASAILLRPTRLKTRRNQVKSSEILAREKMTEYELQMEMKSRLKSMLDNEKLIPRELIFLVRAQRMLQSANQILGSPSNRVRITAAWAARGYALTTLNAPSTTSLSLSAWFARKRSIALFQFALLLIDIGFWSSKAKDWVAVNVFRQEEQAGLEEKLQQQFEKMAEEEFGVDLKEAKAFEG